MLYSLFPHDALDSCHTWTVTLWITYNKVARTFFRRLCTRIMIGNMTRWVFHVIMSLWCHVIWNHSTLEFHRHMWILSSMENISYSSDLISVHGFDIYYLIYMLCIFAVYFYLLHARWVHQYIALRCVHWEHIASDGYTSCALGTSIHSITLCALRTLRAWWLHFMRAGYIVT